MVMQGVDIEFRAAPNAAPPETPLAVGCVGDGTAGSPSSTLTVPVAVHNITDATTQFGTTGSLIDAATHFFEDTTGWFVGVRYDSTLTGANLTTAIAAAVTALGTSESVTGHRPIFIAAPDLTYTDDAGASNTVAAGLNTQAAALRAFAFCDAYSDAVTTASAAATAAAAYYTNNGAARVIPVHGHVTTPSQTIPASAFMLGAAIRHEQIYGYEDSFSNRPLSNISSVSPAMSFSYTETSQAGTLRQTSRTTSLVRTNRSQWIAWGAETNSTDARRDVNVARIIDEIELDAQHIAEGAVDRQLSADFTSNLVADIQDVLTPYVTSGRVSSATVATDPLRNTAAANAMNRLFLVLAIEPYPDAELITLSIEI